MNRERLRRSLFDPGRLAYVAVIAALVVVVDVTFLDLVGIESTTEAILQFLTVTVGAYLGLTLVDLALDMEDEQAEE